MEGFSLKIIKKMKDDGSVSQFGFIDLRDSEDTRSLLRKKLVVDGKEISMRVSHPK